MELITLEHISPQVLAVGDKVLVRNMRNVSRKGGKMDVRWTGPYVIAAHVGKGRYRLMEEKSGNPFKQAINSSRLKKYIERPTQEKNDVTMKEKRNEVTTKEKRNKDTAKEKIGMRMSIYVLFYGDKKQHTNCFYPLGNGAAHENDAWIKELGLKKVDRKILQQKSMLNDRIINAAQKLIKNQFPQVGGLQDPVLSQTSFECCPGEGVQIHHTGNTHWITSSSIGGQPIAVYDSLFDDLTESTEKQLAECYRGFIDIARQFRVEMCPAQLQKGSVDCGLFAIAYAYELASGNTYLNEVSFDQSKMRNHLFGCFERGEISPFPRNRETDVLRVNGPNELVIETFCVCCLPECGDMVQCDLCDNWYHLPCLDLGSCPEDDQEWLCDFCAPPSAKRTKLTV